MAGYSIPKTQWFYNGSPAVNCVVNVYQVATTTPVPVYSDAALTAPLPNPLAGDINGEVEFFVSGSTQLRLVVTTAGGQPIDDVQAFPVPSLAGFTGTGTDLNKIAGVTNGTATANKALVADANNAISGLTAIGTTAGNISPFATDKNILTGGDFSTNPWQDGTSFVAVANSTFTADQWQYNKTGAPTAVHTASKDTDAPTAAQASRYITHSHRLTLTTPQASLAAFDDYTLTQNVEGTIFLAIAQQPAALSFWVKATLPGIYSVGFNNGIADRSYVGEYQIVTANTWEFKTVLVPASPSAGVWDYAAAVGLRVNFTLACGSGYKTTPGVWTTGNFTGSTNQINGVAAGATDFLIALVQLEKGGAATAFDSRSIVAEFARCQRYYQKTFPRATKPAQNAGTSGAMYFISNGTNFGSSLVLPVPMRATPAMVTYNPSAANASWRDLTNAADRPFAGYAASESAVVLSATGTVANAGNSIHYTLNSRI